MRIILPTSSRLERISKRSQLDDSLYYNVALTPVGTDETVLIPGNIDDPAPSLNSYAYKIEKDCMYRWRDRSGKITWFTVGQHGVKYLSRDDITALAAIHKNASILALLPKEDDSN